LNPHGPLPRCLRFASPVAISAETTYVASYHTNAGFYSVDIDYFEFTGVSNGSLHMLRDGDDGGNGVFVYAAGTTFPTQPFNSANYWVDVVFAPNPPPNRYQVNGVQIASSDLSNNAEIAKRTTSQIFSGNNTFRAAVSSTSSFSIQAANGTALLTASTAEERLYIGPVAGNGTGVILVLGNKDTVGDPSGVEGAIYYNNDQRTFRCIRNGIWDACAEPEVDRGFTQYEEFLGGQPTSFVVNDNIGSLGWNAQAIGANGTLSFDPATPAPVADRPGVLALQTPAVANQGTTLLMGNGGGSMLLARNNILKTAVAMGATTNQVLRVGLHTETTSTTQPVSGVWWEANPAASGRWRYCYGDGAAATCADLTTPTLVADTWVRLEIRVTATGTGTSAVTFIINGTFVTLTNITVDTTNRVSPAYSCYTTTVTAQNCYWDYFQLKGTAAAAR
ncbi:MAG: DUF4082 domain-containing protein, partial [Patescibacteria group bacterium]